MKLIRLVPVRRRRFRVSATKLFAIFSCQTPEGNILQEIMADYEFPTRRNGYY
jgi:hypothetical protein